MSSKLQNSIRIGVRINEPVRNSTNRYPALSKNQIEQANLVKKLPNDFPIANWEQMNTKQQLHAMKYSGLNPQEQWTLLNATAPLSALNQHNQAQDEVATRSYVERSIAPLYAQIAQPATAKTGTPSTKSSNSTPLQTTSQQRKLDMRQEEYETRFYEKAAARANSTSNSANPTKAPTAYKPLENTQPKDTGNGGGKIKEWVDNLVSLLSGGVVGGAIPKKSTPKPVASTPKPTVGAPEPVKMSTEEPNLTPTPWLTPMPTSTPKPTPSERDLKAEAIVKKAMGYADANIKYTKKGTSQEEGFDCSGLIKDVCGGSKLVFEQGYIGKSAQGMVTSFLRNSEYASKEYDYTKNTVFPALMPGDLVFSADSDNIKSVAHVTMATGKGLQVVEASDRVGIEKVTYQFDAYDKINKDGLFVRDTDQVVVYVFRPNY